MNPTRVECEKLRGFRLILRSLGFRRIPAKIKNFVVLWQAHPHGEAVLASYEAGLRFGLAPLSPMGLGLNLSAAHGFAFEFPQRRTTDAGVRLELAAFVEFYAYLSSATADGGLGLDADRALEYSLKCARLVLDRAADYEGYKRAVLDEKNAKGLEYAGGLGLLPELAEVPGLTPSTVASKLALASLAGKALNQHAAYYLSLSYPTAFAFCLRAAGPSGLGLPFEDAVRAAVEMVDRRGGLLRFEVDAYAQIYGQFTKSVSEGGFGRPGSEARTDAWEIVKSMESITPGQVSERLEVMRAAESGLGDARSEVEEGRLGPETVKHDYPRPSLKIRGMNLAKSCARVLVAASKWMLDRTNMENLEFKF